MATTLIGVRETDRGPGCDRDSQITKSLLGYGALAGVMYVVTATVQAATRRGYDPMRDDVSLLANGHHGWIQAANFVVSGAMVLAAAVGIHRALLGATRARQAAVLVAGYGAGLIGAGLFRADPSFGFPPGTPAGRPAHASWHGTLHIAAGGLGFLALVAACFAVAGWYAEQGHRSWARYSRVTGVVFLAGFVGIVIGSGNRAATIAFTVAVVAAWTWLAVVSLWLYRHTETTLPAGEAW